MLSTGTDVLEDEITSMSPRRCRWLVPKRLAWDSFTVHRWAPPEKPPPGQPYEAQYLSLAFSATITTRNRRQPLITMSKTIDITVEFT